MSAVEIRKVESRRDLQTFIDFHYDLYEGNEFDVPNLYTDEVNTLRKDKNAAFEFCDAEYYMAYKDGRLVGRVAAIINNRANERWNRKSVRFGWIDFVDDREVSAALLKAVEDYGRSHGMTEVVGPLGFTDMDPEGMLTEGFDQLGTMATIYNYPYYPEHIEAQEGWIVDNKYVEYKILVPDTMPDRHAKLAKMIQRRYNLRVKKVTKKDILRADTDARYSNSSTPHTPTFTASHSSPTARSTSTSTCTSPLPTSASSHSSRMQVPIKSSWELVSPFLRLPMHCASASVDVCSRSDGYTFCAPSSATRPTSSTYCLSACCPNIAQREPTRCSSPTSFRAIRSTDSSGASRR